MQPLVFNHTHLTLAPRKKRAAALACSVHISCTEHGESPCEVSLFFSEHGSSMLVVVVQAFGACWASWVRVSALVCWGRRGDPAHTAPPRDPKRPRRALRHWEFRNNILECTINPKQAFITHFLAPLLRHLARERGGLAWSRRQAWRPCSGLAARGPRRAARVPHLRPEVELLPRD